MYIIHYESSFFSRNAIRTVVLTILLTTLSHLKMGLTIKIIASPTLSERTVTISIFVFSASRLSPRNCVCVYLEVRVKRGSINGRDRDSCSNRRVRNTATVALVKACFFPCDLTLLSTFKVYKTANQKLEN